MRSLIIGMGEIGKAVKAVVETSHTVRTLDINGESTVLDGEGIEALLICFPYSEDFFDYVEKYAREFSPKHIVIFSTVPIGTTKRIMKAVHSPVEGKHPELEMSIIQMERWIGYNDYDEAMFFVRYFEEVGLRTRKVENSDCTEALKLLSTTEYGVNIEFARYKAHVADEIGMDYELTKDWNLEYNKLYKNLGMDKRFQKYVLDAPDGPKGGHCVTPNAELLNEQFPNELVKIVSEK